MWVLWAVERAPACRPAAVGTFAGWGWLRAGGGLYTNMGERDSSTGKVQV